MPLAPPLPRLRPATLRRVGLLLLACAGSVVLAFGALGGFGGLGGFGDLGADDFASSSLHFLGSPGGALALMLGGAAIVIAALVMLHFLPSTPRVAEQLPLPSASRALEWLMLAGSLGVTAWSFGAWAYGASPQPHGDQYAVLGALGAINAWRSVQNLRARPRD